MLRALLTVVYFLLGMSIGIWLFPEVVIMADIELPKVIGNLFVYGAVGALLFLAATASEHPMAEDTSGEIRENSIRTKYNGDFLCINRNVIWLIGGCFTYFIN